jgi:hypothetical protein
MVFKSSSGKSTESVSLSRLAAVLTDESCSTAAAELTGAAFAGAVTGWAEEVREQALRKIAISAKRGIFMIQVVI